jgi:hypothetical protein
MRPLILDSHLLVLLTVGLTSPAYISKHRRLDAYTPEDFRLLESILAGANRVLVTPNSLTEASNLLGYIKEPMRSEIFVVFRELIGRAEEHYVDSTRASNRDEFVRLGLTDAALMEACGSELELLTADLPLYLASSAKGQRAINFHHLREAAGLA